MSVPADPFPPHPATPPGFGPVPSAAPSGTRNTLGAVAIALVAVSALIDLAAGILARLVPLRESGQGSLALLTMGLLAMTAAAAVCAVLALRHERKTLAAVALGFSLASLIGFALWGGFVQLLLPVVLP
ncbi:hypothetical protein [Microbacterium album]|uniref:Uncharacterized protein n=1 Tax=Microbacterium album TaxID=2053191 RepID=A0A917IE67_9MICO|nr:hypothetical protein [Microbacterium album]GGH44158.1 hypothetical protein GCM10010921_18610 [Microbacterium album]